MGTDLFIGTRLLQHCFGVHVFLGEMQNKKGVLVCMIEKTKIITAVQPLINKPPICGPNVHTVISTASGF